MKIPARTKSILKLIKDFKNPLGLELGVANGVNFKFLLKNREDLFLIGIDPYSYSKYKDYKFYKDKDGAKQFPFDSQSEFNEQYKEVKDDLQKMFPRRFRLLRKTSKEASELFQKESLDFVFIDGNHFYQFVKEDINLWMSKVKEGGVLIGHDYNPNDPHLKENVVKAVDEEIGVDKIGRKKGNVWFVLK